MKVITGLNHDIKKKSLSDLKPKWLDVSVTVIVYEAFNPKIFTLSHEIFSY